MVFRLLPSTIKGSAVVAMRPLGKRCSADLPLEGRRGGCQSRAQNGSAHNRWARNPPAPHHRTFSRTKVLLHQLGFSLQERLHADLNVVQTRWLLELIPKGLVGFSSAS